MKTFLENLKASGEKFLGDDDAIWAYAESVGVSDEMLRLAFLKFKDRYLDGKKRYTDWRRVFLNAIEGNWFGLWCWSEKDQTFRLTTTGMQAENALRGAA